MADREELFLSNYENWMEFGSPSLSLCSQMRFVFLYLTPTVKPWFEQQHALRLSLLQLLGSAVKGIPSFDRLTNTVGWQVNPLAAALKRGNAAAARLPH